MLLPLFRCAVLDRGFSLRFLPEDKGARASDCTLNLFSAQIVLMKRKRIPPVLQGDIMATVEGAAFYFVAAKLNCGARMGTGIIIYYVVAIKSKTRKKELCFSLGRMVRHHCTAQPCRECLSVQYISLGVCSSGLLMELDRATASSHTSSGGNVCQLVGT